MGVGVREQACGADLSSRLSVGSSHCTQVSRLVQQVLGPAEWPHQPFYVHVLVGTGSIYLLIVCA